MFFFSLLTPPPPPPNISGVWGQLPNVGQSFPSCSICAAGYTLTADGRACEKIASAETDKWVAVGVSVGLVVAAALGVLIVRLVQRERRRKSFHIFISYRVSTDAGLAERLYAALQAEHFADDDGRPMRVRVFWDKASLETGHGWREQFLRALRESCVFVPLLSEHGLAPCRSSGGSGGPVVDNFLLELETALGLQKRRQLHIYPILIGQSYAEPFDFASCGGHAFPGNTALTMTRLFAIQGDNLCKHGVAPASTADLPQSLIRPLIGFLQSRAWTAQDKKNKAGAGSSSSSLRLARFWRPRSSLTAAGSPEAGRAGGDGGGAGASGRRRVSRSGGLGELGEPLLDDAYGCERAGFEAVRVRVGVGVGESGV